MLITNICHVLVIWLPCCWLLDVKAVCELEINLLAIHRNIYIHSVVPSFVLMKNLVTNGT